MPRKPGNRKLVWMVEKPRSVLDPRSGKKKSVRRAVVRWREGGHVRERTFEDPISAGRFASEKMEELNGDRTVAIDTPTLTFSEWTDSYLGTRYPEYIRWKRGEIKRVSDGYLDQLMHASDLFRAQVGDRRMRDYRVSDFLRFRSLMLADGKRKASTVEGMMMRLKTIFRAAESDGLIVRAPRIEVRQVRYEKETIDPAQIKEIFAAARTWPPENRLFNGATTGRIYPILATLYYTGMRVGELVHLKWDDVRRDTDGKVFEIIIRPKALDPAGSGPRPKKAEWEPKDRDDRVLPAHERLAALLDELSKNRKSPWVFTNAKGERWRESSLASFLHRFEKATGFDIGFHIWRRSVLTHMHDAGVPPGHIQAFAGHSSILTTMRYVRKSSKGTAAAVKVLPDFG